MDDTIINAANPAMPIPSQPPEPATDPVYRKIESIGIDPRLRKILMDIGARFSLTMVMRDTTPEVVAKTVGISDQTMEAIRAGKETDVDVRTLMAISGVLGCPFQIAVAVPMPTPPQS